MKPSAIERTQKNRQKEIAQEGARKLKNRQRLEKASERKELKLKPFEKLAVENRQLNDRAHDMVIYGEAEDKKGHTYSPWIILKQGNETKHSWVVGRVERLTLDYINANQYSFNVHFLDIYDAHQVSQSPLADIDLGAADITQHTYPQETSFPGDLVGRDQIMRIAQIKNRVGDYEPLGAIKRFMKQRTIGKTIDSIAETVSMFEEAVANPDLNPNLARMRAGINHSESAIGA